MIDYKKVLEILNTMHYLAEKQIPRKLICVTHGTDKDAEYTYFCPYCHENITRFCGHMQYKYCPCCGQRFKNFEMRDGG
mgnify:CR=1 FL=1